MSYLDPFDTVSTNPPTKPMKIVGRLAEIEPVKEGDIYEFKYDTGTRAGIEHPQGTCLQVLAKTNFAPHNEIGEGGYNWICRTDFGISVWATLEQCISRGLFIKRRG